MAFAKRWTRKLKAKTRPFRHWLMWKTIQGLEAVVGRLPMNTAVRLGGFFGRLAGYIDGPDRRLAVKNLEMAFGDKMDAKRRRQVAIENFVNLGRCAAELFLARRHGKKLLEGRYTFVGVEKFKMAQEQGKGVIIITGHIDNWEITGMATIHGMGSRLMAVAQKQSDAMVEQWIDETRERYGLEVHKRGADARVLWTNLRQGKSLVVLLDQDTEGVGCFLPFFGKPAYTLLGPALLGVRRNIPIMSAYSVRQPDGLSHQFVIDGPIELPENFGDPESKESLLMQKAKEVTRIAMETVEGCIREHPEQWVWFHRRWKTQPENAPKRKI